MMAFVEANGVIIDTTAQARRLRKQKRIDDYLKYIDELHADGTLCKKCAKRMKERGAQ